MELSPNCSSSRNPNPRKRVADEDLQDERKHLCRRIMTMEEITSCWEEHRFGYNQNKGNKRLPTKTPMMKDVFCVLDFLYDKLGDDKIQGLGTLPCSISYVDAHQACARIVVRGTRGRKTCDEDCTNCSNQACGKQMWRRYGFCGNTGACKALFAFLLGKFCSYVKLKGYSTDYNVQLLACFLFLLHPVKQKKCLENTLSAINVAQCVLSEQILSYMLNVLDASSTADLVTGTRCVDNLLAMKAGAPLSQEFYSPQQFLEFFLAVNSVPKTPPPSLQYSRNPQWHQFPFVVMEGSNCHGFHPHPFLFSGLNNKDWKEWDSDYYNSMLRPKKLIHRKRAPFFQTFLNEMCKENGCIAKMVASLPSSCYQTRLYSIHIEKGFFSESKQRYFNFPFAFELAAILANQMIFDFQTLAPVRFLSMYSTHPGLLVKKGEREKRWGFVFIHEDLGQLKPMYDLSDEQRQCVRKSIKWFQSLLEKSVIGLHWDDPHLETFVFAKCSQISDSVEAVVLTGWSPKTLYSFTAPRFVFPSSFYGNVLFTNYQEELPDVVQSVQETQNKMFETILGLKNLQNEPGEQTQPRCCWMSNIHSSGEYSFVPMLHRDKNLLYAFFRLTCLSHLRQCEFGGLLDAKTYLPVPTCVGNSTSIYIFQPKLSKESPSSMEARSSSLTEENVTFHTHFGENFACFPSVRDLENCVDYSNKHGSYAMHCVAVPCGVWVYFWDMKHVPTGKRHCLEKIIITLAYSFLRKTRNRSISSFGYHRLPNPISIVTDCFFWQAQCNGMWEMNIDEIWQSLLSSSDDRCEKFRPKHGWTSRDVSWFQAHPNIFHVDFVPFCPEWFSEQ